MPPQRIWFLRHFGLKTGIDFAYLGLNSGMVFEGIRECMNVFVINKKERGHANSKWIVRNLFVAF